MSFVAYNSKYLIFYEVKNYNYHTDLMNVFASSIRSLNTPKELFRQCYRWLHYEWNMMSWDIKHDFRNVKTVLKYVGI